MTAVANPQQAIEQHLERWEELTQLEGEAIKGFKWEALKQHQADKAQLMEVMEALLEGDQVNRQLCQEQIQRLLKLESGNAQQLALQSQATQSRMDASKGSQRRLGQLRNVYGSGARDETILGHYS